MLFSSCCCFLLQLSWVFSTNHFLSYFGTLVLICGFLVTYPHFFFLKYMYSPFIVDMRWIDHIVTLTCLIILNDLSSDFGGNWVGLWLLTRFTIVCLNSLLRSNGLVPTRLYQNILLLKEMIYLNLETSTLESCSNFLLWYYLCFISSR